MLNMPVSLLSNGFLPYLVLGLATMVEGPITLLIGGAAVSSGLLLLFRFIFRLYPAILLRIWAGMPWGGFSEGSFPAISSKTWGKSGTGQSSGK